MLTELRALPRDPVAWALAACFVAGTAVVALLLDDLPGATFSLPLVLIVPTLLAAVFALTVRRGDPLAAGALALAVTPAALAAVAAAEPAGAFAVLVAGAATILGWWGGRMTPVAWAFAACIAVVAIGRWVSVTPDRGGPAPTWGDAMVRTGDQLRRSVGALDTIIAPTTGWLVWWVGVGLLVGAAIVAGDLWHAAVIPLAATAMVIAAWLLIRGRGDVDISGGMWIITSAVAFTGSSVRLDDGTARRIGLALLIITAFIWLVAIIHVVRT
jgi:hypothetical protein